MSASADYRSRIYARYATEFKDSGAQFDAAAAWNWGRAYRHYLRGWLPEPRAAEILDVACGGGRLLYFYKTLGYSRIAGVDVSAEQVALARQVAPDVAEADVLEHLAESREGRYALISGIDIIEHFHKPEVLRFLDLTHRALARGGRLVLQTPNADSPWAAGYRYGDFTHEVAFNADVLSRLMHLAGFRDVEARELGPIPFGHSAASTCRYVLWAAIRWGLKLSSLAELGTAGSNVLTRAFLICGVKK